MGCALAYTQHKGESKTMRKIRRLDGWHPDMPAPMACGCDYARQCATAVRLWSDKTLAYHAGRFAEYGRLGNEYRRHIGKAPYFCENCGGIGENHFPPCV